MICADYDDYDYYYYGLTHYIIEYPGDGSTSWIFIVIIYFISPLCGVAETPDCGMLIIYMQHEYAIME